MDEAIFQNRAKRLQQVNAVIEKLDPAIRAAAFDLISDYVVGTGATGPKKAHAVPRDDQGPEGDAEAFFTQFENGKPDDNAKSAAAFHFSRYGSVPFSMGEIKEIARSVGLTIPRRLDMTFRAAQHKGKALFHSTARGQYQPTVHGEAFLKSTFKVKKGTQQREAEAP